MSNVITYVKSAFAAVGALLGGLLGGWDMALKALVLLVVCDYLAGVAAGFYTKTLSSERSAKGIVKKVCYFIIVAVAVQIDLLIGSGDTLRMATIFFYIATEGISILEKLTKMDIPFPAFVKNALLIMKKNSEKNSIDKVGE